MIAVKSMPAVGLWLQNSRLLQAGLIAGFWCAGEVLVRVTHLPFPGSVAGLFLLLIFLLSGIIRLTTVQRGAQLYLAEMLLFFIPAVLAVLNHPEFAGLLGLKVLAVIFGGTIMVMTATALSIELGMRVSRYMTKDRDVMRDRAGV
jgi:holin-like protein